VPYTTNIDVTKNCFYMLNIPQWTHVVGGALSNDDVRLLFCLSPFVPFVIDS